jgi:predicted small secreted protein
MKKVLFFVMIATALSACNTVHGIGQDIEKGGEIIKDSAK